LGAKLLDIAVGGRQYVDRYELVGEIASGGMATVYLGRLTGAGGFQRLYAIKRLHPHLQGEKEFVEMFLDEARLAAGIHHPHVVPILEVGASESGYYLVMEYIEGETLAKLLARAASSKERIPLPIGIRAGLDMLSGLHAAHELRDETGAVAGVVHRDVSPQNVLVGADGITRITDFGVARAASRLTATRVGQLKGKIAYMAPEQARGEADLDRRADIFAAGIVIWEALAHKRLFKAESEAGTLARVINEPIPSLVKTAPHVPTAIDAVVMKALDRRLEHRYQTCAEFADALERAAIQTGQLASSRDMQAYVRQVIGAEMQTQQVALRAWTARADAEPHSRPLVTPTKRTFSAVATEATPSATGLTELSRSGGRRVWALAALVVLGAVGFFGFRWLTEPDQVAVSPANAGPGAPTAPDDEPAAAKPVATTTPESKPSADTVGSSLDDLAEVDKSATAPAADASESTSKRPATTQTTKPRPDSGSGSKPTGKNPRDILGTNPYR
jgi:serine/threonine protein kinase